jgi:hypothetical protein
MTFDQALAHAMAANNMLDEHVAIASELSIYTIRDLRLGYSKNPRRTTVSALKRAIPGFAELLANGVAA